jgi:hypothetical protein
MSRPVVEPWICGSCRSLNQQSASRCYKCRTPRALVEADPTRLVVAGEGHSAAVEAATKAAHASAIGGYKDSWLLSIATQGLLIATAIIAVLATIAGADIWHLVFESGALEGGFTASLVLAILVWVVAAATLLAWAGWLSRVVDNVPKVGLGWPNVTPSAAFIENFLPGWNLYRVPAIVRDVLHRLEPQNGRGEMLLVAAWLALVGGVVMPRTIRAAASLFFESPEDLAAVHVVLGQVGLGLTAVGIAFLIMLIRRVEDEMQAAADKVAPTPGLQPTAEPVS